MNPKIPSHDSNLDFIVTSKPIQTLLFVIPGIGTREPTKWQDDHGITWLKEIPHSIAPGLAVVGFQHGITASSLSWQALLSQGETFLNSLLRFVEIEGLEHCPIALIAHSAGGFIVKEALRSAHEQHFGLSVLIQALAGAVLLGTPHSTSEDAEIWDKISLFASPRRKRIVDARDRDLLAGSCLRFEQASMALPILSAYETKSTKIKTSVINNKKVFVAGQQETQTNASGEQLLVLDSDHGGLCNVNVKARSFQTICSFLTTAFEDARLRIVKGSPEYKAASVLDQWTVNDYGDYAPLRAKGKKSDHESNRTDPSVPTGGQATAGSSDMGFEIVPPLLDDQFTLRRKLQLPCHMISPPSNRDFFGRSNVLAMMDDEFFSSKKRSPRIPLRLEMETTKTFAICGPGGVGKTQIATEYAYSRKDKFDAIFWIFADQISKIAKGFAKIAEALGILSKDSADSRDPVVIRELVKGWLANPVKDNDYPEDDQRPVAATWLLVIDNVDHLELLEDYWPLDGPGCVLVTSRDPLAKNSTYLASSGIDLQPFDTDEAAEFLKRLTKKDGDSSAVARRLGGFPLAMTQMAGIIVRRDLTFAEFLRYYDEEESHVELLSESRTQRSRSGYEHTLASVWALESLKHGSTLLDVCSLLDPDGIQEGLLNDHVMRVPLETFPKTFTAYQRARTELYQSSLISKNKTAKKIMVHRLVQDAARSKMDASRLRLAFSSAVSIVSSAWPYEGSETFAWRHGVARWRICQELFPHVVCIKRFASQIRLTDDSFPFDLELARLLTDAGWYFHESGNSFEAAPFFNLAQSLAEALMKSSTQKSLQTSPKDPTLMKLRSILAEIHHNSGCVGTETNDPAGTLQHFLKFNEMMREEIGDGPPGKDMRLAISWNELGNAYMLNKMWKKGKECFFTAMETMQRVEGFTRTDLSFPFVNLGLAYWFLRRPDQAAETLLEGLHDREAALGKDDKDSFITGRFLHALGNVKASQGMLNESFVYHERALRQYMSTIGGNHHRTGDVYVKVAEHCMRLARYEEALSHLDQALRIFNDRPVFTPEKARAMFKQALVLRANEQTVAAENAERTSVQLYRKIRPGDFHRSENLSEADFDDLVAFWSQ